MHITQMLFGKVRSFCPDRRGNVAVIFGLALLPLFGLVGAAVDYSRANSARTSLQAALDATGLMMSKEALTTLTNTGAAQQKAQAYFNTIFNWPGATVSPIQVAYNSATTSLTISANGSVNTTVFKVFANAFNMSPNLAFGASSSIAWGNQRLRVALVLDTTGSMAQNSKMSNLQSATNSLLTQLKNAAANPGDVYVSIVPFTVHVNGGASNFAQTWIDWTSLWEAQPMKNGSPDVPSSNVGPGSACPYSGNGYKCASTPTNDPNCNLGNNNTCASTIPSSGMICPSADNGSKIPSKGYRFYNGCYNSVGTSSTSTNQVCTGKNCTCTGYTNCSCTGNGNNTVCSQTVTTVGPPYTHTWIPNDHSTWTGCLADRGTNTAPGTGSGPDQNVNPAPSSSNPVPADQYVLPCPAQMMALNYNWNTMQTFVNGLSAAGATNQPIGLVWGWQSLVGGGPFGTVPTEDSNYQYNHVIVLFTDGLNTQDRWYGDGHTVNTGAALSVDGRMSGTSGTCQNIKNNNVTIYAVQVDSADTGYGQSALLQNCASTLSKYYYLTDPTQLGTIFQQIGTQISKLRISH